MRVEFSGRHSVSSSASETSASFPADKAKSRACERTLTRAHESWCLDLPWCVPWLVQLVRRPDWTRLHGPLRGCCLRSAIPTRAQARIESTLFVKCRVDTSDENTGTRNSSGPEIDRQLSNCIPLLAQKEHFQARCTLTEEV